jgi:hypothetical protein
VRQSRAIEALDAPIEEKGTLPAQDRLFVYGDYVTFPIERPRNPRHFRRASLSRFHIWPMAAHSIRSQGDHNRTFIN